MKRRERIYIDGERFEGAVSPSRTFSDIMDRTSGGAFVLVDREGLEELRNVALSILGEEPPFFQAKRFEAFVSQSGKYADIVDRRQGKRVLGLDKKAVDELRRMVDELVSVMVD